MGPHKMLGVASAMGRVGYKENVANSKHALKELRSSCVGTVHLATLLPPRAGFRDGCQPTARSESQTLSPAPGQTLHSSSKKAREEEGQ